MLLYLTISLNFITLPTIRVHVFGVWMGRARTMSRGPRRPRSKPGRARLCWPYHCVPWGKVWRASACCFYQCVIKWYLLLLEGLIIKSRGRILLHWFLQINISLSIQTNVIYIQVKLLIQRIWQQTSNRGSVFFNDKMVFTLHKGIDN